MTFIRIRLTKNNIYYHLKVNQEEWTRSLGVFGIKNAYKRFPNAFEEITIKILNEMELKNVPKVVNIEWDGYQSNTRQLLLTYLLKAGYELNQINDKTQVQHNGCRYKKKRR